MCQSRFFPYLFKGEGEKTEGNCRPKGMGNPMISTAQRIDYEKVAPEAYEALERVTIYSAQEKAALAWTEAVTLISEDHAPDKVFEEVRKYFSEKDIVDLTMAIIAINSWNRLSISMRDLLPA